MPSLTQLWYQHWLLKLSVVQLLSWAQAWVSQLLRHLEVPWEPRANPKSETPLDLSAFVRYHYLSSYPGRRTELLFLNCFFILHLISCQVIHSHAHLSQQILLGPFPEARYGVQFWEYCGGQNWHGFCSHPQIWNYQLEYTCERKFQSVWESATGDII